MHLVPLSEEVHHSASMLEQHLGWDYGLGLGLGLELGLGLGLGWGWGRVGVRVRRRGAAPA